MRRRLIGLITIATLLVGGAVAEAAIKTGSYSGMTSEKNTVTFKIASKHIKSFKSSIDYDGACGSGGGPGYTISVKSVALKKNGTFSARITFLGPTPSVPNGKGVLKGKAKGKSVTGSIEMTTAPAGHWTASCLAKHPYSETFTSKRKHG